MLKEGNQQNIANAFLEKNIITIKDFIAEFCKLTTTTSQHNFSGINETDIIQVTGTPDDDIVLFNDLEKVFEILTEEEILNFGSNKNHGEPINYFQKNGNIYPYKPMTEITNVIKKYMAKTFIINKIELEKFIERGYKSKSEFDNERDKKISAQYQSESLKYQKRSYWRDVIYVSLIFIGTVTSIYFGFKSLKL